MKKVLVGTGTSLSLAATAAAIAIAYRGGGWAIAAVLASAFLVALGAGIAPHLTFARQRMAAPRMAPMPVRRPAAEAASRQRAAAMAAFRVVGTRGVCPLGYRMGDTVRVGAAGEVTPALCPEAQAMLRMASQAEGSNGRQWCCPVYDHLLVFRREPVAVPA